MDGSIDVNTRLVTEKGLEERVAHIVEPAIQDLGFDLVRVRITGENGCTVQIMAERSDGSMDVEACEKISRTLSPLLDAEDPINREYYLELSSPGLDRPLVRKRDFMAWTGFEAKLEMNQPINNRRRYRGQLDGVFGDELQLILPDAPEGEDAVIRLPLDRLNEARLVMTDALLEAAAAKPEKGQGGLSDRQDISEADQDE